jgi:hypothetical protein
VDALILLGPVYCTRSLLFYDYKAIVSFPHFSRRPKILMGRHTGRSLVIILDELSILI